MFDIAIFVLGTVIPPLLPTVFVVSVGISAKRLQGKRITCTYQEGLLIAGKVDAAFFDKTGTMTKQSLDFISLDAGSDELTEVATLGMAVSHTLHKTSDGTLIGNNVDTVSFLYTGGELVDGARVKFRDGLYTILKQYEFDSHRQTQSVVVQDASGKKTIYVKGSPEAIRSLCDADVPLNFGETLSTSAKGGIYQLAIAFKSYDFGDDVELADISRDDVEKSLRFGAFMNFRNSLREETPSVIKELQEGNVTVTMITGDSVLTGICIAKSAGMIAEGRSVVLARKAADGEIYWSDSGTDEECTAPTENILSMPNNHVDLAITGEAWASMLQDDPKYATSVAKYIRVFGRCNPSHKVSVVAHFVVQGSKTLMCGDGGNDCGSLKTAHVGIALSTAEGKLQESLAATSTSLHTHNLQNYSILATASVVAPFTSLDKEITSVTEVLREGRCALASAFSAYSYYIIYGQLESYLQGASEI